MSITLNDRSHPLTVGMNGSDCSVYVKLNDSNILSVVDNGVSVKGKLDADNDVVSGEAGLLNHHTRIQSLEDLASNFSQRIQSLEDSVELIQQQISDLMIKTSIMFSNGYTLITDPYISKFDTYEGDSGKPLISIQLFENTGSIDPRKIIIPPFPDAIIDGVQYIELHIEASGRVLHRITSGGGDDYYSYYHIDTSVFIKPDTGIVIGEIRCLDGPLGETPSNPNKYNAYKITYNKYNLQLNIGHVTPDSGGIFNWCLFPSNGSIEVMSRSVTMRPAIGYY